ncbi:MAG: nicotinamide mononucleotide transporter, partial [Clostridia bacterium]|nr:nicotinamide mononucleotide transporter [Clostridia bacterium]
MKLRNYFSKGEMLLWGGSVALIIIFFILFDRKEYLTLTASLIGATSLIFNAKGNPVGQLLMVIFSVLYGIISYSFSYYGEMITYVGMTGPMALLALVSWLKNPYNGNRAEVRVNRISKGEWLLSSLLAVGVTAVFYFIL